ncbi:unnamed protein product [Ixodes hexagonus]
MQEATWYVGKVATAVTLVSFGSGLPLVRRMYRQRSSRDVPLLPLTAGCLCTLVWMLYGYAANDATVVFVNQVGTTLQVVNVLVHRLYAKDGQGSLVFWGFAVLAAAACACWRHVGAAHLGMLGSVATVCCHLSPLPGVPRVLRERDSSALPFSIIAWTFVVSLLWGVYGLLVRDVNLYAANLFGVVITAFELVLCAVFPGHSKRA